jgi:hypothetical protein
LTAIIFLNILKIKQDFKCLRKNTKNCIANGLTKYKNNQVMIIPLKVFEIQTTPIELDETSSDDGI